LPEDVSIAAFRHTSRSPQARGAWRGLPAWRQRQRPGPIAAALTAVLMAALLLSACGARTTRPVTTGPAFPQFEFPAVPGQLESSSASVVDSHREAWDLLQAGNTKAAAKRFSTIVHTSPQFYPSTTGLAYTALAQHDYKEALADFDRALGAAPEYLPALLGRADALVATNQVADAVEALDKVLAIDPARAEVRTRVDTLRFRGVEDLVAEARKQQQGGHFDQARTAYQRALQASPESAFLHRELAGVERQAGRLDAAAEQAQAAVKLDDRDAATHVLLGEIEESRGNLKPALAEYQRARSLNGPGTLDPRIADLERRLALAEMPEAYRAIPDAPKVTRGELAALIGVRLETWIATAPIVRPGLMTDVRSHWANRWIQQVARAGLMDIYPNHTFQPESAVQRTDLAWVVTRVLNVVAARQQALAQSWRSARPMFSDLPPTHAAYPAAALAVGAGVLQAGPENSFQPTRPISGAEAVAVMDRLEALVARRP
jgi:tetratricopeptide (TPR) repeat protein